MASDSPGTLSIAWDAVTPEATDYRVNWAKVDESFPSYKSAEGNAYPTINSFVVTGLDEGAEYKVHVRARYRDPSTRRLSKSGPWSDTATLTVAAQAPVEPDPVPNSNSNVDEPPADADSVRAGAIDLGDISEVTKTRFP